MELKEVITMLEQLSPPSFAEDWDNSGLMCGRAAKEVKSILLSVDATDEVVEEAVLTGADLLLTHHPLIFPSVSHITEEDHVGRKLLKLIASDVACYSMHTNFDAGKDGMNDALANALHLEDIKRLETAPMARGGRLPKKMEIHEFAKYVNKCLGLEYSHLIHAGKDEIETAAIIGGGGSREFINAMLEGYDIYISGDIPHHARRDVISNHYNFLDVCHEVERIFMPQMKKILLEIDPTLNVEIIDHEELPELIK